MHKETDRLIEIVRARLKVPAEAAAFIEADLRGSIASENPPAGQIATLNRRLARGRTLAWVFTLLAAIAVLAASFGSVRTFRLLDSTTPSQRLLASLSGSERLKMAAWIGLNDPHESAEAWLDAEPTNLSARELWIATASFEERNVENLKPFVAESERMDPGNGIYQLHLLLAKVRSRGTVHIQLNEEVDLVLAHDHLQSRLGSLQLEIHQLIGRKFDYAAATARISSLHRFHTYSEIAAEFQQHLVSVRGVYVGHEEHRRRYDRHRMYLEKSAPFLQARSFMAPPPLYDLPPLVRQAGASTSGFSVSIEPDRLPSLLESWAEHVPNVEGSMEPAYVILHRAGLNHELVNPLNQMHWAWMDRRMAVHAAWGIIALTILTCFVPLLRGVFTHHAANALQWMMPARDHFFAAFGAWVVTVGTAIIFLTMGPRPRVARLDSELDLYFYVPVAAMFLLLVFSFTALFHRWRGRLLGWKGVHPLMLILPIPVALFSLWAQFAWHGEPRLMRVNASCAGLFGLITMSGLLYHALGDASRTLERTVLIKQFIKSLIVASLLMSATAGACYLHELHWGKQDRLINHAHGRPVFFDLRDELLRQSHEYQLQSLRRQP
jgi:hypothetical protein